MRIIVGNSIYKIAVLLLILFSGCLPEEEVELPEHIERLDNLTVYPVEAEPMYSVNLEREQSFGDSDYVYFSLMSSVAVDDYGRVFIADLRENRVHVFQPDGSYLTSFGRTGSGPGEALQTVKIIIRSSRLYVYDLTQRVVNVFTLPSGRQASPEFSHTVNIAGEHWNRVAEPGYLPPSLHSVREDGSFLLFTRLSPHIYREDQDAAGYMRYYLVDSDGMNVSDVIFEQKEPGHIVTEWFIIPPPFFERGLMAVSNDDRIFSVWTAEFLVKVHDSDGIYQRAIYYPFSKTPLDREAAINSVDDHEQLHEAVRNMQLPESWPALSRLLIDDKNRIWVAAIVDDFDVYEWWILKESGELLGRFTWPRDQVIEEIKNDYMYIREIDEETDLQQIVRYRIEMQ